MRYGPVMIDLKGSTLLEEERELVAHPAVGGILLFSRNFTSIEALKSLVTSLRHLNPKKPLLIAVDHEGGRVWRFETGFKKLPPAKIYGETYDRSPAEGLKQAQESGALMAKELINCGLDISLAPVLDLDKGLSSVIGDRAFHADPEKVAKLAKAFIEGMRAAGMSATGKHFPGHGSCKLDSHIAAPEDFRKFETIWAEDLVPFRELSSSLQAMMPAHVLYPEVDTLPAGFSKIWLQGILRDKIGFEGAVISDCLSMKGAAIGGDYVVRTRLALDAGCDMVILSQQSREDLKWILNKLERETSEPSHRRLSRLTARLAEEKTASVTN